ncbi:hypothetical protein [Campylobacter concisus]|uniref:Uncharacterized protein n=1 Tax=Campylobacter concisus TaxID=199 RepID=A0A1Y5NFR2_9BACT|nr:hypothetical protein [Campylobacter concisus]OUT19718.1 hypothetical protein B9N61_01275 [Campylobacter concisus]
MNENVNKNLDENLDVEMATASKNENQNLDENASQTLGETKQSRENLEENIKKTSCGANWALNLAKKTLEISLQSAGGVLACAGKAGEWLGNLANELKDDAKKAELSKINEEQAKFDGAQIISNDLVKDIVAKRLKTEADNVEFGQIYLGKMEAFNKASREYFYEAKAKFNDFLYCFKIAAGNGEILSLKIKS